MVVILLGFMSEFLEISPNADVSVDYNSGDARKYISITESYKKLGKDFCLALLFFHCFSGADATAAFYKLTKKAWFNYWISFPMKDELTRCFQILSCCPTVEEVAEAMKLIAKFVMFAYNKNISDTDIDEFRLQMFHRSSVNDLRILPPSAASLALHIYRSAYQAGWVWGNTLSLNPMPSTEFWGWRIHKGHLCIKWTFNSRVDLDPATGICKCKTLKCTACICAKSSRRCLTFCTCSRSCKNV